MSPKGCCYQARLRLQQNGTLRRARQAGWSRRQCYVLFVAKKKASCSPREALSGQLNAHAALGAGFPALASLADSALMRIKSASHERQRNRGADRTLSTVGLAAAPKAPASCQRLVMRRSTGVLGERAKQR